MPEPFKLLNAQAARELLMNEPDVITRRFMIAIKFFPGAHINRKNEPQLSADFDMLFFMTVVRLFFQEHEFVRDILDGKEINSFEADEE